MDMDSQGCGPGVPNINRCFEHRDRRRILQIPARVSIPHRTHLAPRSHARTSAVDLHKSAARPWTQAPINRNRISQRRFVRSDPVSHRSLPFRFGILLNPWAGLPAKIFTGHLSQVSNEVSPNTGPNSLHQVVQCPRQTPLRGWIAIPAFHASECRSNLSNVGVRKAGLPHLIKNHRPIVGKYRLDALPQPNIAAPGRNC